MQFARYAVLKYFEAQRRRKRLVFSDEVLELVADEAAAANRELDGRQEALRSCVELVPNNGDLLIGSAHGAVSQAEAPGAFEGLMSELVLVRRVMLGEEMRAMYMAGRPEL